MPSGESCRCFLGNLDEFDRRRKVAARRHSIPELEEIVLQVLLEICQRLTIHSGRASIRFHSFVRFPNDDFGIAYGFAVVMSSSFSVDSVH